MNPISLGEMVFYHLPLHLCGKFLFGSPTTHHHCVPFTLPLPPPPPTTTPMPARLLAPLLPCLGVLLPPYLPAMPFLPSMHYYFPSFSPCCLLPGAFGCVFRHFFLLLYFLPAAVPCLFFLHYSWVGRTPPCPLGFCFCYYCPLSSCCACLALSSLELCSPAVEVLLLLSNLLCTPHTTSCASCLGGWVCLG